MSGSHPKGAITLELRCERCGYILACCSMESPMGSLMDIAYGEGCQMVAIDCIKFWFVNDESKRGRVGGQAYVCENCLPSQVREAANVLLTWLAQPKLPDTRSRWQRFKAWLLGR